MPFALIGAGISLFNGINSNNAASNASNAQQASEQAKIDENRRQYDLTRTDNAPRIRTGNAALAKLSDYLGLTQPQAALQGIGGTAPQSRDHLRASLLPQFTSRAASSGVNPDQSNYSQGGSLNMLQQLRASQPGGDPFGGGVDEAGLNAAIDSALAQQTSAQTAQQPAPGPNTGSLLKQFTGDSVATDPGYQFGLTEGMKGINNRLNAGGGMYGGAAIKAAGRFGNDYATTKFGEAYNRDAADKSRIHGMLSGVAGTGQTASNQVAQAGQFATGQIGNAFSSQGDARASGYLAQNNAMGNALNQGVSGLKNWYQNRENPQSIGGTPNPDFDPYKAFGGVW